MHVKHMLQVSKTRQNSEESLCTQDAEEKFSTQVRSINEPYDNANQNLRYANFL